MGSRTQGTLEQGEVDAGFESDEIHLNGADNSVVCAVWPQGDTGDRIREANAARLVECWNACEGITDGKAVATLKALRDCRDDLRKLLEDEDAGNDESRDAFVALCDLLDHLGGCR